MDGECFCGAVKYRLIDRPMFVQCCHCTDCQTQTGGPFAINGLIERDRIELEPDSLEPVAVSMPTSSGRPHDIYRCPTCQTAVWSDYGRRRHLVFLRISTLAERHAIVPQAHIFTRSKAPWVALPEGTKAFDVYYEMNEEWPAASLARRAAVMAKVQS